MSAATRQWITDNYGPLFARHGDKNRRTGEFMEIMIEGVQAGELSTIEFFKIGFGPVVGALDHDLMLRFAHSGTESPPAESGKEGGTTPPIPGLGNGEVSPGSAPGGCGTGLDGGITIPGQRSFLPADLVHARIVEVSKQLLAIKGNQKHLREQEKDSRAFRKLLDGQYAELEDQLRSLRRAQEHMKKNPEIGLDALAALGIGAAELGMSDADLAVLVGAV
ncbi:hypothetical protein OHA84_37180 [Streptomyces sp. NBC_00513]|uniref:hypothetical protein n=1 Tax=unclassified Streptomyces TaxID=2593676 RepID=UPI0022583114|nr:hypothetical protein [Streptomyces sp. NBC_00424]MCX5078599.1 hypothetical protein [Streptomyces sp. NBC_00424]WUD39045.1 hypothetical protein OHA84_00120 [Streptomyces sp. NBC_00513]WUD45684.1 hypothetical protein OHA84_37180 [Streptomyces sp. NBC_00513]